MRNKNAEDQAAAMQRKKEESREELEDELKTAKELMRVTELRHEGGRQKEMELRAKVEDVKRCDVCFRIRCSTGGVGPDLCF